MLRQAAAHIDMVRLGWGSAYVTADLEQKLAAYRAHDVPVMLGGTLTELAWLHGRVDELCGWLDELGIDALEVSSGVVAIPPAEKAALIERLAARYTVFAEVGEKDPAALMAPYRWVALIREALEAGAQLVICEGRATGTAGLYRPDGEARAGLIDEIVHEIDRGKLVFEAPQQAPAGVADRALRARREPRQRAAGGGAVAGDAAPRPARRHARAVSSGRRRPMELSASPSC